MNKMFEASLEELQEVPGVGLKSAILLKTMPEMLRRYANEKDDCGKKI